MYWSPSLIHHVLGMDCLEQRKSQHVVVPGLNWIIATLYDAEKFGYTNKKAETVGYKAELEAAVLGLREMHRRGIVVLPGGYVHHSLHSFRHPASPS